MRAAKTVDGATGRHETHAAELASEGRTLRTPDPGRDPGSVFTQTLDAAARMPGVRIDRTAYLRAALRRHCSDAQIERAVAGTPAAAGVPIEVITLVADETIAHETRNVTALSTVAGLPGGIALIGTVPLDAAQYSGHLLRVVQKLAYLYSWPDLFADDGEDMDDATEGVLTLFVGVMLGVQLAQTGVTKVSSMIAAQVVKQLPRQALTKGAIYPVVKKVATYAGVHMTKQVFARGAAKVVPVLGAVLSGGLAYGTFRPMSKRLQRHLAGLELTKPDLRPGDR